MGSFRQLRQPLDKVNEAIRNNSIHEGMSAIKSLRQKGG